MHSVLVTILLLLVLSKEVVSSGFDDDSDLATYVTVGALSGGFAEMQFFSVPPRG